MRYGYSSTNNPLAVSCQCSCSCFARNLLFSFMNTVSLCCFHLLRVFFSLILAYSLYMLICCYVSGNEFAMILFFWGCECHCCSRCRVSFGWQACKWIQCFYEPSGSWFAPFTLLMETGRLLLIRWVGAWVKVGLCVGVCHFPCVCVTEPLSVAVWAFGCWEGTPTTLFCPAL